jgi:uncharacterized membrane protein
MRWQLILDMVAVGGLVMTAWDLIMDPIKMAGGNWVWVVKGAYFGIPLQNYWGWWLTILTTFALNLWLSGKTIKPAPTGFDRLALASYPVAVLGIVAAAPFTGAGGLALIGFFPMLPRVVAGWLQIMCRADSRAIFPDIG